MVLMAASLLIGGASFYLAWRWAGAVRLKGNPKKIQGLWPDALVLLGGCLRAGLTLNDALGVMVEESPEPLRSLLRSRLREVGDWSSVDVRVQRLLNDHFLTLPRLALCLSLEWGGDVVHVLDMSAQLLRKKMEMKQRIDVLTASGRLSAWVVGASPFVMMLVLMWLSPDFMAPLFNCRAGRLLLGLVVLLVTAGLWMVHRVAQVGDE